MSGDIYIDGRYAESNPDYHVADSAWKAAQVRSLLDQHGMRPRTVGEIGCGAGEILSQLCDALPNVSEFEGWDVSPQAIGRCRGRERERLTFIEGDLLSEARAPFDVVLCLDVFEHVEDYLGFLRRLRDKGRAFIFHIPLDMSVQSITRQSPIRAARERLGHLHYFTWETALAALKATGYTLDGWRYTAGSLDLPDRSLLQKVARIPRRVGFAIAPHLTVRILGGFSLLVLAH